MVLPMLFASPSITSLSTEALLDYLFDGSREAFCDDSFLERFETIDFSLLRAVMLLLRRVFSALR